VSEQKITVSGSKVVVLDDGTFITDAGNLLGVKSRARIKGAMHPILLDTGEGNVLIDAGFGPELPASLEGRYELRRKLDLLESMREAGYRPEEVTAIILSHLDPDHIGWALRPRSFPNATVYVQRAALEEARKMPEEEERHEAVPLVERAVEEGWCELLEGEREILPGVRVEVRPGHAEGHQIVWIGSGEELALYTGDLAPAKIWLDPDLISSVDTDPKAARTNRIEVLSEAVRLDAPVILYHEPTEPLVRVRRTEKGFEAVPLGS